MGDQAIRVLLIDDDEDDVVLTRDLLSAARGATFEIEATQRYEEGLRLVTEVAFDVVLLDYRLGERTGLDFLGRLPLGEATPPVILLTGQGDRGTDVLAMQAGAADYLAKGGLTTTMLERAIRYAVERHHATLAKHDAERRYQMLIESVGAIVWQGDPDTLRFTFVSRQAEHMLGHAVERWTREDGFWLEHMHPDDRAWVRDLCEEAIRTRQSGMFDYRMLAADGRVVWLRDVMRWVEVGSRWLVAGVMLDVTREKEAEERLRVQDRAMSAIIDGISICDARAPDCPIVYVNPAFEELTGYEARDVVGRNCRLLQGPDTDPDTVAVIRAGLAAEDTLSVDLLNYRKDGTPFWNNLALSPVRGVGGVLTHFVGIQRDITESRAAERKVRQLASALENLQEEAVSITDDVGRLVYANEAHARLFGYAPADRDALRSTRFLPDDEALEELASAIDAVRGGRGWSGLVRRRRADDGRVVQVDLTMSAVPEGDQLLYFEVSRDASKRLSGEQHLRRVERLAGMGTLIAGVAHELNNPLSAILGLAQLMALEPHTDEDRDDLAMITREAERMAKIVSDLKLVARDTQQDGGRAEAVDLNDVVRHVARTREYFLRTHNVELRLDLAESLPRVLADRAQMEQVVLNLMVNAEQAMSSQTGQRMLIVRTRRSAEQGTVHVVDNGPGIPAEHLARIFDPFFTTKPPGEGTGLGLALVHGIVSEHGGAIHVESEPGKGTAFRVSLPLAPAVSEEGIRPACDHPVVSRRVLVVDDEDAVRRVIVRMLARRGHVVTEATDGNHALAILEASAEPFDVIVTDLRMPGLGGDQLRARLEDDGRDFARRLVFLTGDSASPEALQVIGGGTVPVLAKPGGLAELALVVERIAEAEERRACRDPESRAKAG